MTDRELMQQALEALKKHAELGLLAGATITAIKEALAQPEQEPVAWMTPTGALYRTEDVDECFDEKHIPLYTSPPASKPWVGLTDKEYQELHLQMGSVYFFYQDYGRAIEAKLKEKNT